MSPRFNTSAPRGAVDLEQVPKRFRCIIERVHTRDVSILLQAEAKRVQPDGWTSSVRPYVPGEFYPEQPPQRSIVTSTLLIPGRDTDLDLARRFNLQDVLRQPCLLRVCIWPDMQGAHVPYQLTPLSRRGVAVLAQAMRRARR